MSLINQMLSDLEARRGGLRRDNDAVLAGLSAIERPAGRRMGTALSVFSAGLFGAGVTLAAVWVTFETDSVAGTPPAQSLAVSGVGPTVPGDDPVTTIQTGGGMPPAIAAPAPEGIEPVDEADGEDTSAAPDASADTGVPSTEVVDGPLETAEPAPVSREEPPVAATPRPMDSAPPPMRFDNELMAAAVTPPGPPGPLVEMAAPAVEGAALPTMAATGPDHAVEDLPPEALDAPAASDAEPAPVVMPSQFEKTPSPVDRERRPEDGYRRALEHAQAGRTAAAVEAFAEVLERQPEHVDARLAFIGVLQGLGETQDAQALLAEGAELLPREPRLTMPYAGLLVERGDLAGALATLERGAPEMTPEHAEYHAFKAALCQRLARHRDAIALYSAVLETRSDNGVWWVGLGISLMADGRGNEALDAFRQALDDASLSRNLRRYVTERIDEIEKARG
jgi:MSHA biogenesis protein MshN